jgi:DNA (cytosine-5)-methyltransferase 1
MRCGSNYSAHLAVAQPVAFRDTADCLTAAYGTKWNGNASADNGSLFAAQPVYGTDCYNGAITGDVAATLGTPGSSVNASGPTVMQPVGIFQDSEFGVQQYGSAGTLLGRIPDHQMVMQPIGIDEEQNACVDGFGTLKARIEGGGFEGSVMTPAMQVRRLTPVECELTKGHSHAVAQPVAFEPGSIARNAGPAGESSLAPTLRSDMGDNQPAVRIAMQVRRLTPVECERLQGFPDGYTNIPWRKQPEAPDGPRYKALGNSMAVPCMAWIGKRIAEVDRGD